MSASGEERELRKKEIRYLSLTAWAAIAGTLLSTIGVAIGLWQTRKSFETGQRAWITVTGAQLMPIGGKDAPPIPLTAGVPNTVILVFRNGGQSPALQFQVTTAEKIFNGPTCGYVELDSPYRGEVLTVGPGQEPQDNIIQFTPSWECVAAINAGADTLRIRGSATYKDIFGNPHETRYCFQYEGLRMHALSACPDGNDIN